MDIFKPVLYPYPITCLEQFPTTLGVFLSTGHYVWVMQAMHWYSHAHSPFHSQLSVEITCGMTAQAAQVLSSDESITANEQVGSVSVKTFSLETYTKEEILFFNGQLIDAKQALHDIAQEHRHQLLPSFWSLDYDYAWWMMYVALQADSNPADKCDAITLARSGLFPNLWYGHIRAIMNEQQKRPCVSQLSAQSDQGWVQEGLHVQSDWRDKRICSLLREIINWVRWRMSVLPLSGAIPLLLSRWQGCSTTLIRFWRSSSWHSWEPSQRKLCNTWCRLNF